MWRELRWLVIVAFLVGAPVIARAQSGTDAGAPGSVAAGSPSSSTSGSGVTAGANPPKNAPPGRDRTNVSRGSLMPCRPGPPYTSLPCRPVER
jgi:hypothetical protein